MTEENKEDVALSSDWFCKLPAPRVDAENAWKDDIMDRQRFGQSLLNFLQRETQPLTVALHGQWGAGKTFFLERWRTDLEKEGVPVVYLNAWEDDFLDDPMTSLFGQAYAQIKDDSWKECWKTACEIAPKLVKGAVLKVISHASEGLVPEEAQHFQSVAENACEEYQSILARKRSFQENLAQFAQTQRDKTGSPLVFIVDELDRCRPLHTIQFLERIKHFFAVPNVAFVLGVDLVNLKKSIAAVYGEIDVDAYLRRFFDFEFWLKEATSEEYFKILAEKYGVYELIKTPNSYRNNFVFEMIKRKFDAEKVSLRQIEFFMRSLVFGLKSSGIECECSRNFQDFLLIFATLRTFEPQLYDELKHQSLLWSALKKTIDYLINLYNNYQKSNDKNLPLDISYASELETIVTNFYILGSVSSSEFDESNFHQECEDYWKKRVFPSFFSDLTNEFDDDFQTKIMRHLHAYFHRPLFRSSTRTSITVSQICNALDGVF